MSESDYLADELKAVKLAIRNEHKVRDFYLEHAKDLVDELAKKTFIFLADEELKHIDAINEFMKSINEGNVPEVEVGSESEAVERSREFFSISIKEYALKAKATKKEVSVYELGLEMELKGYNFYKKSAEAATHPNVKALFEFLIKEEDAHYHLLQNALSYFKHPEEYFESEEGWFFEG